MAKFVDRKFIYLGLFYGIFMALLMMMIDWKNGVHHFESDAVMRYFALWLFGGVIFATLYKLLHGWFNRKKPGQ